MISTVYYHVIYPCIGHAKLNHITITISLVDANKNASQHYSLVSFLLLHLLSLLRLKSWMDLLLMIIATEFHAHLSLGDYQSPPLLRSPGNFIWLFLHSDAIHYSGNLSWSRPSPLCGRTRIGSFHSCGCQKKKNWRCVTCCCNVLWSRSSSSLQLGGGGRVDGGDWGVGVAEEPVSAEFILAGKLGKKLQNGTGQLRPRAASVD